MSMVTMKKPKVGWLITVSEAAKQFNVPSSTIYSWIHKRRLAAIFGPRKVGRRGCDLLIDTDDVRQLCENRIVRRRDNVTSRSSV